MGRALAVSIGFVYGFISLLAGLMLEIVPTGATNTTVEVLWGTYSYSWWNYPAILVIAPNGVLALPFFPTISMVVVSAGVGLGMAAGVILAGRLLRDRKAVQKGSAGASSLAGMTPAMIAFLTLGACCSTSAAAAAGIGVVAQASGTTYEQLLANSWYLNVFQMVVLFVALLAQEQLLAIYVDPAQQADPTESTDRSASPRRAIAGGLFRALLMAAGTLWAVSAFLGAAQPLGNAPLGGYAAAELLQHVLPGGLAVVVALLPRDALAGPRAWFSRRRGWPGRALLAGVGATLLVGVPPPLTAWGFGGIANQLLGALGAGPAAGGVGLPYGTGVGLLLSWVLFYGLLGALCLVLAIRPERLGVALFGPGATGSTDPEAAAAVGPDRSARSFLSAWDGGTVGAPDEESHPGG